MQIIRRSLFFPLHYWRTIVLVSCVGLLVAQTFRDQLAVLLCTLACAFVFADYERRRWLSMSSHFHMGDILLRISLSLSFTFVLTQHVAR